MDFGTGCAYLSAPYFRQPLGELVRVGVNTHILGELERPELAEEWVELDARSDGTVFALSPDDGHQLLPVA